METSETVTAHAVLVKKGSVGDTESRRTWMSSLALPQELRTWNNPPAYSGWRSFAPVLMLDGHVYWLNKKRIEILYQLDELDSASEDEIDELLALLGDVLSTIDGYLKVRGSGHILLKKIRLQRHSIAMAMDAIKRGYAPGKLPAEAARVELGNSRLRALLSASGRRYGNPSTRFPRGVRPFFLPAQSTTRTTD